MTDRPVAVVPTRNAAEGFAALLALDPSLDAAANAGPMTEAGRAIQTLVVTEAVRDATIGGRKVKHGQTIALDPDDGLVAVDDDREKAVLAAIAALDAGLRAGHALLRRRRRPRRGRGAGPRIGAHRARRRGRGPPRRPAALPLPDLGRVGVAKAPRRPIAAAADRPGRARFDRRSAQSGLGRRRPRCGGPASGSASTTSATCCSTCRAATTTCARCAKLGDLVWVEDGTVVSARVTRRATSGSSRRSGGRIQRTIAGSRTRPAAIDATWFGRRFIERRLHVGGEVVVSGKVKHFGRKLTLDNPEFQVGRRGRRELLHAGRIVPVYRLTAGLTAARLRIGDPRGARPGRPRLPGVPAGGDRRRGGARADRPGARGGPLPGHRSRAATRPSAGSPSTSCSRSSSAWSRGAGSGAATPRRRSPSTTPADAAIRTRPRRGARRRGSARAVELTDDQDAAIDAIRERPARPTPMLRLLQGDVGSGKTAVAAYALAAAARAGLQGALLAPTDLLARQHLETVGALLDGPRHRRHAPDRLAQGRRRRPRRSRRSRRARRRSSSGPTP